MADPIVRTVKRYICPHCHRGWSKRPDAINHITLCVHNPDARSCRTCLHHRPGTDATYDEPGSEEYCTQGLLTVEHISRAEPLPRGCREWEVR